MKSQSGKLKVIDFPNKPYEQYLYYLTAKALINVQYVEKAIKCICCRFRPKPATHSGLNLPLIPGETCHPFRK